ncbi:MAG TPA: PspA/IM30 family protein [Ktedonobacterales bacterium]
MGVLSRFTNYIKTVMSSFLDRAEDPGQALDYSYEKQMEQLQKLRQSLADVAMNKNYLKLQEAKSQADVQKYDEQARNALKLGREDLARAALERKQLVQTQLGSFDQQLEQLQAQQEKFDDLQRRLEARISAFRTQKEMVKAQYGAAQAQVKIQEAATGISEEMSDVNLAVQRAQDKVLKMQARANALDELTASGSLPEIGAPAGSDQIDQQLAALSNQSEVDRQLAAMKAQMQLPEPEAQQQGQLPPASSSSPQS